MSKTRNKTRQTLTAVAIQKPIKEGIQLRDGLFVALENGYIIPATSQTAIEGCAINDVFEGEVTKEPANFEDTSHRACIYFPKRRWETFSMDVENGEITQADVGQTFLIIGELQHINYTTKSETGGQFRLERVITATKGEFTYYFDSALSPQGPKGEDGDTPTFKFEPVVTLPVGSPADMEYTQDGNQYTITFKIPAGRPGTDGKAGAQGDKGDTGDTIDLVIGTVSEGDADASITVASPTLRKLNLTIPRGEDGEDGVSPTPRDEWSSAKTYDYLDIVRYPDEDGVGCAWIRSDKTTQATSDDVPGESPSWMLLVKDGADGEQGPEGGTVIVPVEGKPGKDGIGVAGKDGTDGKSWTNKGTFSTTASYPALSTVRAFTGEYDEYGNEIRAWYGTNNGASDGTEPRESSKWDLIVKDGGAKDGNKRTAMVFMSSDQQCPGTFDSDGNGTPMQAKFTTYTGNKDMVTQEGIVITQPGHYRIVGHCIVQNNTGDNMYINLGRMGIHLTPGQSSGRSQVWLGTAKQGGAYATKQGPRVDLTVDCQFDLYEGDTLTMYYRAQTDTDASVMTSQTCTFTYKGALDASGDVKTYLGGLASTYLAVQWMSKLQRQSEASGKYAQSI